MSRLANKKILIGVCAGIAAYKSADLVRRLRDSGAEVRVVMSRNSARFISALTLQAVSGHPVHHKLLDAEAESGMGHIELARWADAVLIAPATANFMARLAHGMADELLTTLCLATAAPIALAPAMNQQMWDNAATRANADTLSTRGVAIFGPAAGAQACGEVGPGRMLEPLELVDCLEALFAPRRLAGLKVVVTAGPTWEALDPVRGITNLSSGKMGYAVARAAAGAGAEVVLVSGPTSLAPPAHVRTVRVQSALAMHDAVLSEVPDAAIFIGVAAVADYRPVHTADQKIKKRKDSDEMVLRLVKNPDILAAVAALPGGPFTVGFAAETEKLEQHARQKLLGKSIDMIAANLVGLEKDGFGADTNSLVIIDRHGSETLASMDKPTLARLLIDRIADRYASDKTQDPRPAHR